ncbi:succinate dehydrogenase subunit 7, mitochondrial-like [Phragmites australis]|uniref:succinate dehydrogenase subunit 7, mitochondrial-like n=1 Tax=Phragmites australis TaxID=29695 RepID=UPI002D79220A|nr:succinate dehydrogenase subunit 7, mitochondrial-like [Phragmites australis]
MAPQPAFLSTLRSSLRSPLPPSHPRLQPSRGYHVELGAREKALLEEDSALKRFKSYKNSVKQVSKIGNVLTLAVVVACSYEIAVLATSTK